MNIKRDIIFLVGCLFILSQPLNAFADKCDDVFDEASRIFDSAEAASKQEKYEEAIGLYEEAEDSYRKASEMENCRCPTLTGTAKRNVTTCQENADSIRKGLEKRQGDYEAEMEVYEIYNQAQMKYNEAATYAKSQQWDNAVIAFEEAGEIWESIASTDTENGKKAIKSAKQARDMAELARQRL